MRKSFHQMLINDLKLKPKSYVKWEPNEEDPQLKKLPDWDMLDDIYFDGAKCMITPLIEDDNNTYFNKLKQTSFCCIGIPGSQKTELAVKLYDNKTLMLGFQNTTVENFKKKIKRKYPQISEGNCHTFDSEFGRTIDSQTLLKYSRIIVDEFSLIPLKWINKLYQVHIDNPKIVIQLFGDPNQCHPVDDRYFDYMNKYAFHEICGNNLMMKKYVPGCSRYDENLHKILDYLLTKRTLHPNLKDKSYVSNAWMNICYTNQFRWGLIKRANPYVKCDKTNEYFHIGMKVMATTNMKPVFNGAMYYI
jgi:hypothetical protein